MAFDRRETLFLLLGDFFVLVASLWVALLLRNLAVPSLGYFETNVVPFVPMFLISLIIFYIAGLYEKQTRPIRRVMGARILGAQVATVALAAILFFILPLSIAPKTILVLYLIISVVVESVWRFYRMNREMKEENRIPALLVGSDSAVLELFDEVRGNPKYLINFAQYLDTAGLENGAMVNAIISAIKSGVRAVVIDTFNPMIVRSLPELYAFMADSIVFIEFESLYEEIFDRIPLQHIDAGQLLETLLKHRMVYDAAKRLFDVILAVAGSIVAVPFIGIAAILLFLQGGAPFIHQERIGKGGRIFRIVKLRSRVLPFDDRGDPELHKKNHVTALGRILRKTRIDELPQLWNVLAGELSFIGPRPELPKIAEVYEREIPQYRMRHLITPGLSGWAQIHDADAPRGSADVARTRRKLSFDLYYLKHRSFGLDLAIVIKTLRTLISFSGT